LHIEKTHDRSFRGSGLGLAYCDLTRRGSGDNRRQLIRDRIEASKVRVIISQSTMGRARTFLTKG
jgi:hypothetical protein